MKNRPLYWVIIISTVLFVVLLSISPKQDALDPALLPWNASYDENGQLHALGIHLGKSTLRDLTALYGRDIEVKLFEMPDGERSAEAYIHSAYIGSIHGALVAKLALTKEQVDGYYVRGARTTISKQGAREVQLNNQDTLDLFNYPIRELTLVPRRNLTEEAIEKRFGQPDRIEKDQDDLQHWYYDSKGLELILLEGSNDILRYTHQNH